MLRIVALLILAHSINIANGRRIRNRICDSCTRTTEAYIPPTTSRTTWTYPTTTTRVQTVKNNQGSGVASGMCRDGEEKRNGTTLLVCERGYFVARACVMDQARVQPGDILKIQDFVMTCKQAYGNMLAFRYTGCINLSNNQIIPPDGIFYVAGQKSNCIILLVLTINVKCSIRIKRKFINYEPSFWQSEFPIEYSFDGTHNHRQMQMIRFALGYWRNTTCLEFEEHEDQPQTYRIVFTRDGPTCHSEVGKNYMLYTLRVSLPDRCFKMGTLIHEISHALGFYHEHSRPDRDDYIKIHTENTHSDLRGQRSSYEIEPINTHGIPYDYGSIMHYKTLVHRESISDPIQKAISTHIALYQKTIGQHDQLSFYDVKLMNKVYCSDSCAKELPCAHHGYTNPRDCSSCLCPDGFIGLTCDAIMQGVGDPCGDYFVLGPADVRTINSPRYPDKYPQGQECSWFIKTRYPKQVIKLKIVGPKFETYCDTEEMLCMDYLEIRNSSKDLANTGMRLCCDTDEYFNKPIYSDGTAMLVLLRSYHRSGYGFMAEITAVKRSSIRPHAIRDELRFV